MYNQPFFIPSYYGRVFPGIIGRTMGRNVATNAFRGGLFSRLASTFGAIKNFNWSGLINNTSKTLGVINQTIPIVKQAGPMINNMRSMIKLASIFKDETDNNNKSNLNNISNDYINKDNSNKDLDYSNNSSSNYYNSPTFFIS